jgi:hypothetical protein
MLGNAENAGLEEFTGPAISISHLSKADIAATVTIFINRSLMRSIDVALKAARLSPENSLRIVTDGL